MYTEPRLAEPVVLSPTRTVSQPAKKSRVLFGREYLDTTYRRAKALIIEHRLFRMIRVVA